MQGSLQCDHLAWYLAVTNTVCCYEKKEDRAGMQASTVGQRNNPQVKHTDLSLLDSAHPQVHVLTGVWRVSANIQHNRLSS